MASPERSGLTSLDAVEDAARLLETSKKRRLAHIGLAVGTIAASFLAATAKPNNALARPDASGGARVSHPLEYVGMASNRIWVLDLNEARKAAQDIAATNANTVRIFEPYNMTQTQVDFDIPRLCNAAEAARENNLTLEISTIGVHRNSQNQLKHNYVPSSPGNVSRYLNFVKTILLDLAGPRANQPGPNGAPPCVQEPLNKIIMEDFNEVGSSGFNSNQDAAKKYAFLESRAIPALAKDAADINHALEAVSPSDPEDAPPFTLVHAVGALAIGNHDPLGFLKDFDRELKRLGVTDPGFLLALHPYPSDPSANPAQVEAGIYPAVRQELDTAWGKNTVPIFYDEFGSPAISKSKRFLYGNRSLSAAVMTEGQQAQYYKDAFVEESLEEGVVGGLIFQGQDESNDGWPTGIKRPDGSHKDSWNTVAQTFFDARAGNLQK